MLDFMDSDQKDLRSLSDLSCILANMLLERQVTFCQSLYKGISTIISLKLDLANYIVTSYFVSKTFIQEVDVSCNVKHNDSSNCM